MKGENQSYVLKDIYNPKSNSFDFMRLILAVFVIFSHSFPLLYGSATEDILVKFTKHQIGFGNLAVYSFFVISGFLITQSYLNSKSTYGYFRKRVLRIIPAFLMSLIIISFVIGPLLTNNLAHYFDFANSNNPFLFVIKNITFNIFGYSWAPSDLFEFNPFPSGANGSMWTLKHEVALYILVPLLGYLYFFRHRAQLLVLTICTIVLSVLNIKFGYNPVLLPGDRFWVIGAYEYNNFIQLAPFFLSGCVLYIYKDRVLVNKRFLFAALALVIFSSFTNHIRISLLFLLPYIIIVLCTKIKFPNFNKYGDVSYGMYIYAFPIQQTVVLLFKDKLNIVSFFLLSLFFTFIISFISWHLVEQKALKYKEIKQKKVKSISM